MKAMNEHLNQLTETLRNVESKYFPYAYIEKKQVNVSLRFKRSFCV